MRKEDLRRITNSEEETKETARDFAKNLKGGEVICLYGELGSGKTVFVKGLAESLGIKERVISPTFILLRSYTPERSRISRLHHIDLYRLADTQAMGYLGLKDLLSEKRSVIVIEWAEKIKNLLPETRIDIFFKTLSENKRKIKILTASPNPDLLKIL